MTVVSKPASLRLDLEAAVAMMEDAMKRPPAELTYEVDLVERRIVGVRDRLIAILRGGGQPASRARDALDVVNAALSLVAGVEYPATGIQRSMLEQARDAIRRLLEEDRLPA